MIEKWKLFEHHIVNKLKELDKYSRRTPGSGNKGLKGDVYTQCGLHIEAKWRNTESVTIKKDVWEKLNQEIPLHADRIPVLCLENKDGKRWAVLDLDTFLDLYIEHYKAKKIFDNLTE